MGFCKDPIPRETWLVYNGLKSIKINRDKVASSCWYFENLLEGQFKEAKQYTIEMNLGDAFSFEAFKCIVKFADNGEFKRDTSRYEMHLEAIQLALIWGYDEFVDKIQDHLIESNICRREIDVLTSLAKKYLPQLSRLNDACDLFAVKMAERTPRPIPRCPVEGHKEHMYIHCRGPREGDLMNDDWEKKVTWYMNEEEKLQLARDREEDAKPRHRFHNIKIPTKSKNWT